MAEAAPADAPAAKPRSPRSRKPKVAEAVAEVLASDPVDKVAVVEAPPAVVAAPVEIVLAPLQPDPGDAPAAATGPVPDPEAGVDSKPRRKGWWSPGR